MNHKKNSGFTLLEVIIALSIMASVLIVLTSGWRGNFLRVKKIKFKTQAALLLQEKMSEIEIQYKDRAEELPKDLQKGKFKEKRFRKYSWQWQAREFKMPDLKKLLLADKESDQVTQTVVDNLKNYFETSIKELKVTVVYQASPKAKPQKISLATIMVNYNNTLNLGLGL